MVCPPIDEVSVERRRHALPQLECALLTYNAKGGGDHAAILHLDLGEWVGSYIICGSLNQTYSSSSTIYILYIPRPTHTIYAYMVYLWVGGIFRANTNTTTTRQHREMGWEMRIVDGSWVCVVGGGKRARQLHLTPVHLIN